MIETQSIVYHFHFKMEILDGTLISSNMVLIILIKLSVYIFNYLMIF